MFDGNHRSRRQVNLGRRRVKSRNSNNKNENDDENKTSILARTEALRKQRHEATQRDHAARRGQRVWRGYAVRCRIQQECRLRLVGGEGASSSSSSNKNNNNNQPPLSLEKHVVLLNYYVRRFGMTNKSTTSDELRTLLHGLATRLATTTSPPLLLLSDHVWIHGITQACLRYMALVWTAPSSLSTTTTTKEEGDNSLEWLQSLWQACQTLVPPTSPRFLGNGLILLAETTILTGTQPREQQERHDFHNNHHSSSSLNNGDALYQVLQQQILARTTTTTTTTHHPLLAAVGWATGRLTDDASLAFVVETLTHNTTTSSNTATATKTAEDPLVAAARRLTPTHVLLQRALPRPTLLPVVLHAWRDHPTVLALTQWLVLGRSEASWWEGRVNNNATANIAAEDVSDSDDDDDDDMDIEPARATTTATTRRSGKPQISTLVKLDRLARETVDKWRQAVARNNKTLGDTAATVVQLTTTLADPQLWITWGRTCLGDNSNEAVASSYVTALLQILPTGLYARHTATSPVLTKLAFDAGILQALFRYAELHPTCLTTLTVLSNVLAQTLMVIKDDEFMATYTGPHAIVSAARIIVLLREALYHVYWVTPVEADDITTGFAGMAQPNPTAHFILAGTKLYNALYQRWCRTVRHVDSFASEDIWWFPNLSTSARVQLDGRAQPPQEEDDDSSVDSDAMDISPADVESEALAAAFDDPKLSRVLTSIPQALPFEKRVKLFDSLVKADKTKTQDESRDMQHAIAAMMRGQEFENGGRQRVEIRREHLYQDAMHQLNTLGPKLRQKVQVSFINQHGAVEAGIDGGGVFKEFLDDLVKDAFSLEQSATSTLPLFTVTSLETLAINLDYANRPDLLSHYEFLGRAIGKAVYEGILVDPQFCLPFLNQLLGKANSLEDLRNLDPTYYKNLTKLLSLKSCDFSSLGLTFEVSIGSTGRTVELKPGGSQVAVTPENVIPYAHLVAHQLLNVQSAAQTRAFLRGFRDLIPAPWVRLFAAHELQKIISGDDRGLDVSSFKATMQYAAGYHPSQPIMQWFWEIVEKDLTQDQQCKLLKFMTSCSRQPLLGFSSLEPAPCIQQIRLPEALFLQEPVEILKKAPLPTSSTCMNLLKLPNYRSKELMRIKLVAAIESGAGFELT